MNNLVRIDNSNNGMNIWDQNDQLKQIKEIYGKNLTSGEFTTLVQIGKATGLNPFLREVWAVKYGSGSAQIFIGRDGYRKSAQSHHLYDYHQVDAIYINDLFEMSNGDVTHKYSFKDRGDLIGAYCLVKRKDASKPIFIFVELKEYSTGKSLWATQGGKPATMIKKVAEAQGLRMAFQALFAGTYDESEKWEDKQILSKPGRGVDFLKSKLGIQTEKPINESITEHTGEVTNSDFLNTSDPITQNDDLISIESIKTKIINADTIQDLIDAVDLVNSLSNFDDKKQLMALYRDRKKELDK